MNYDLIENLLFVKDSKNNVERIVNLDAIIHVSEDSNWSGYINIDVGKEKYSLCCSMFQFSQILYAYKKGLPALL